MICSTTWSEEDKMWVGKCDKYPSLSYLDTNRECALIGIEWVVEKIESGDYREEATDDFFDTFFDDDWLFNDEYDTPSDSIVESEQYKSLEDVPF